MRKFFVALALLGALGCAACNDQKSDTTAADKAAADKAAADKTAPTTTAPENNNMSSEPAKPTPSPTPAP